MAKVIMINTKTRTIRVENADKNIDWITVKGTHVPIEKGQSKSSAVKSFVESKRGGQSDWEKQFGPLDKPLSKSAIKRIQKEDFDKNVRDAARRNAEEKASKAREKALKDQEEAEFQKWKLKRQQPKPHDAYAKPFWDDHHKSPYKDAPTLYEFLKKNDYTYPDMAKYKEYTWDEFLDDARKGTVPKPFAKADTAQVDKLYDYAFHKTGKDQDKFADWVKKSVTWHGDSNKPERDWYRGKDEDEDAYYDRREKTLAEARKIDKVSDWYKKAYAGDDAFPKNKDITFDELANKMLDGTLGEFYEAVGVGESDVREKIFQELSERTGRPYDDFYDAWLHGGQKGTSGRAQKQKESIAYMDKLLELNTDMDPDLRKMIVAARDRAKKELKQ